MTEALTLYHDPVSAVQRAHLHAEAMVLDTDSAAEIMATMDALESALTLRAADMGDVEFRLALLGTHLRQQDADPWAMRMVEALAADFAHLLPSPHRALAA